MNRLPKKGGEIDQRGKVSLFSEKSGSQSWQRALKQVMRGLAGDHSEGYTRIDLIKYFNY